MLYKSAAGNEIQHASSSSLDEFRQCRRKFYWHRILGWKQKDRKAALEFGKCVEAAIQFYHENKNSGGVDEFKRLWLKFEKVELKFTDQEADWGNLYQNGIDMLKLYEARVPSLPVRNPKFQLEYRKNPFTGSSLEFLAYVDMLSTLEDGKRIVVDIKTAKAGLDLDPNMLSMDPQLRRYAWVTGIYDVAFLWLVKASQKVSAGDTVSLLDDTLVFHPGDEATVLNTDSEKDIYLLGPAAMYEELTKAKKEIKGTGAKKLQEELVQSYFSKEGVVALPREAFTKSKLQFIRALIPEEELVDTGNSIGHGIIQIKDAAENNRFPQDGGVRWPNDQCTWCEYRGLCLKNEELTNELLVQVRKTEDKEEEVELEW